MLHTARARRGFLVVLVVAAAATWLGALAVGAVHIPLTTILEMFTRSDAGTADVAARTIVFHLRMPRALMAALAGVALATAGTLMQGIFHNPLASPYLLGVASGASTGAAAVLLLGITGPAFLPLGAFIGGVAATALVYGLARSSEHAPSPIAMILIGVAVATLFSAATSYLLFQYAGSDRAMDLVFWMMGGLGRSTWRTVGWSASFVVPLAILTLFLARSLDAMALGDRGARHVGVSVDLLRLAILAVSTLLTAAVVGFVGTIGFVGLITPHAMRLLLGPGHRWLLPAAALAGAVFLMSADMVARTVAAPAELPIGIITALIGVPFFLLLVRQRRILS